MKIKRLLIGMFVCILAAGMAFATGSSNAISKRAYDQGKEDSGKIMKSAKSSNSNIIELGPDNIAGRVRSVIIDNRDSTNQTLWAGGVAGGLYKTTDGGQHWNRVPMHLPNGTEVTLPISCMTQTSDGVIYIGTGEGFVPTGNNNGICGPIGRGLYRFVDENTYNVIPSTKPASDTVTNANADWSYINRLAFAEYNNVLYFYAATNTGLYRWVINSASDWNNAPTKVFTGSVQDIDVAISKGILYFTATHTIYKIGNIANATQSCVEISRNYFDTTNISRIEVAVAPSDENYVYAVIADTNGMLKGVYLTTNQQVWNIVSTSTVSIFSRLNKGTHNNTIAVFPNNAKKIIVGGNALWIGEGFEGATLFTWTKSSSTEDELNSGNYMGSVYVSSHYVHSGAHQIVFPSHMNSSVDYSTFYVATDGGVFSSTNAGNSFTMCNKGLNTTQFYSLAVATDASVFGGAQDNSIPFIQSRNASDSGSLNTTAQVIWYGNGGGVASSMFQLISPMSRRYLLVSSNGSNLGRTYADYNEFTNTQTWSTGLDFTGNSNGEYIFNGGPNVPPALLWETTNDTRIADSVTFTMDTNSWVKRGDSVMYIRNADLTSPDRTNFNILRNDTILVRSRRHFDYPFKYVFDHNFNASEELTHTVKNPIQSRLFFAAAKDGKNKLFLTANATDFTKLQNAIAWKCLIEFNESVPHAMAISKDGDCLFVSIDRSDSTTRLVRIKNLLSGETDGVNLYQPDNTHGFVVDTLVLGDTNFLRRPITSISYDPRDGRDNVIVTCGGFENTPNIYYITNASTNYTVNAKTLVANNMPVYSSLIEDSTGNVYVGSDNGLFITDNINNAQPTWTTHGDFLGVPIFAIKQQTNNMKYTSTTYVSGANFDTYSWGKTKYPRAIYYATYGRGLFMDKQYISDTVNAISIDGPQNVTNSNTIKVYPNPANNYAHIDFSVAENTTVDIQMFDMSGKMVYTKSLGKVATGLHSQIIPCEQLKKGVYVVRVAAGTQPMTSKLIVK